MVSSGKKVLVIEDNPINLELAVTLLEAAGHVVLRAEDAESGIALARAEGPALILMDVGLPGMDGLEATGILRGDPKTRHIPIVALTAHAMKGDRERALEAGCHGYIEKPINTRQFPRAIAGFLELGGDAKRPETGP